MKGHPEAVGTSSRYIDLLDGSLPGEREAGLGSLCMGKVNDEYLDKLMGTI